jgi:hypothetical protein
MIKTPLDMQGHKAMGSCSAAFANLTVRPDWAAGLST